VGTTAEITQGAGAAALLIESDPSLVELDLGTIGYCSRNVDDFFRPLGAETARVKGTYSMQNYQESFESALADHCARRGVTPAEALEETDVFVLHTPFRNMPIVAMVRTLENHLGFSEVEAEAFLDARGFHTGVEAVAKIGNTYNASMYFVLAHSLEERYRSLGDEIVGKRVMMASYGSGSTMSVMSGRVAQRAPQVISAWNLESLDSGARRASTAEYEEWVQGATPPLPDGRPGFHLRSVRADGYRVYGLGLKRELSLDPQPLELAVAAASA
jgi:hydroxymethylglutaryl-CoA synthase